MQAKEEATLTANTTSEVTATPTPAGMAAPLNDGQDTFTVNQLQSMESARLLATPDHGITVRRDSLDLDGQAGTDFYVVNTTGSQSSTPSDYVINVLDAGAKDDGTDVLTVNGSDAGDLFLLRKAAYLVGRPNAESLAFVDLLHGTVQQAQAHTLDPHVERINYDVNINGRLIVNGLGGNDYFASDDNSAITTLDGGAGDDSFQVGQAFGTARVPADVAPEDVFNTILTTRGYLSPGISFPMVIYGGTGNDAFQVYSNQAELRLDGGGIPVCVADAIAGLVVITESGGNTIVSEAGQTDTYTVHLAMAPDAGETMYLTVSAADAPSEDFANGSRTILVSKDGGATWNSALVLDFTAANFSQNQTITVKAIDDPAPEGTQTVMIGTGVLVSGPTDSLGFNQVAARNVQVTVLDNDQPDLYVTQPVNGPLVLAGDVNTRIQDSYSLSLAQAPAPGTTVTVTFGHEAVLAPVEQRPALPRRAGRHADARLRQNQLVHARRNHHHGRR